MVRIVHCTARLAFKRSGTDLYWMILPSFSAGNPAFGIWEADIIAGAAGVRRTTNLDGLPPVLKRPPALYSLSKSGIHQAISCFENVLEHDAQDSEPHSGLADVYSLLGIAGSARPREVIPKAKAEVLRALELDETVAEAHASLATVRFSYD